MRIYMILAGVCAAMILGTEGGFAGMDLALAQTDGNVVARMHFVGTQKLAADPQAAKLNEFGAMPETAALRDKTLDKLATAPYRLLVHKIAQGNTNNFAALIRPMLDDLLANESYWEVRGPTNSVPELMLAVHLPNARAQLWQAFLTTVLESWTGVRITPLSGDGYTGWELKKHHDPNVIHFLHAGDWVLFGWGWNDLKLQPVFLQRLKATGHPYQTTGADWLDLLVDAPAILAHHPVAFPFPLPATPPKMHLTVQGRKTFIRPQLVMQFPAPLNLKLEPWRLPLNELRDKFVSFSIARGIGPWLNNLPLVQPLHLDPVPNQFTVWSLITVPLETSVALPVADAASYLTKIGPQLVTELNTAFAQEGIKGSAAWTNGSVRVSQMPFFSPYVQAARETNGDFIIAGLFPHAHATNSESLPPELLQEIKSKPELVYGDWEENEPRVDQWHLLQQTYLMSRTKMLPSPERPAQKWLLTAKKKMGYCGTEVTLTAPNELTLVRNSSLGLTGFDLNMIAYWLDSENFPFQPIYEFPKSIGMGKRPPHH